MRICKFCQQEVPYKPLKEMEEHGIDVHFCYKCNAEYLYWKEKDEDGDLVSWSLYVEISGKMYRWTYSTAETAQLWWIKDPGKPGTRRNYDLQFIYGCGKKSSYESTAIPDMNPQN